MLQALIDDHLKAEGVDSLLENPVSIIDWEVIQLPWSFIDYLIVHELVHTKIKNHSKEFWAEVSKHIPNYKDLDARMGDMRV